MSDEFGDLEKEIVKAIKNDFEVGVEAERRLDNLRNILGTMRARIIHGKEKIPYGSEVLASWRKQKQSDKTGEKK